MSKKRGKIDMSSGQEDLIDLSWSRRLKEPSYNKSMPKLMIDGKEVEKGDWIIVEGDGWSEIGCVVDIDEDEINMYDGKEGWCVDREEITQINWQ